MTAKERKDCLKQAQKIAPTTIGIKDDNQGSWFGYDEYDIPTTHITEIGEEPEVLK